MNTLVTTTLMWRQKPMYEHIDRQCTYLPYHSMKGVKKWDDRTLQVGFVGKLQKLTVRVFLFFQGSMKFTFFYAWEASDTRVMSVSFYVNKPLTPVKAVTSRFFFNLHILWNNRTAPYLWENGKKRLGISRYTSYNMLNRWTNYHCGYSHKVAHWLIHFVNINKHDLFDSNRLFVW